MRALTTAGLAPESSRRTQGGRLFQLLSDRRGQWVPAYEVAAVAGLQFGARLLELRGDGHHITNKLEHHQGKVLSWYRLEGEPPPITTLDLEEDCQPALFPLLTGGHRDDG